jgi:phage-related holin
LKTLLIILAIFTTFFTPIKGLILIMILFILSDTALGIYTSIKLGGVETFKSHKLFNIVVKSFFYLTTIIMAFLIDKFILGGMLLGITHLLAKVMTAFWIYIEIKSLDESSMKLGNKSFWVLFKEFIDKLKSLKKDLNEIIEDKKE